MSLTKAFPSNSRAGRITVPQHPAERFTDAQAAYRPDLTLKFSTGWPWLGKRSSDTVGAGLGWKSCHVESKIRNGNIRVGYLTKKLSKFPSVCNEEVSSWKEFLQQLLQRSGKLGDARKECACLAVAPQKNKRFKTSFVRQWIQMPWDLCSCMFYKVLPLHLFLPSLLPAYTWPIVDIVPSNSWLLHHEAWAFLFVFSAVSMQKSLPCSY